jgi:flagellar biosynthetic protein FliP
MSLPENRDHSIHAVEDGTKQMNAHESTRNIIIGAAAVVVLLGCAPTTAIAQTTAGFDNPFHIPDARSLLPTAKDGNGVSATLQILTIMTVLTLVPSILIMTTCFARIVIVFGLLRQAMATPQLPPSQILMAVAMFMTFLVMAPTWQRIHNDALKPYLDSEMSQRDAFDIAGSHLRDFMYAQIDKNENYEEVYMFLEYDRGEPIPEDEAVTLDKVPTRVLVPAFILSELKIAFLMGFRIYLPFLVIDMVIAAVLISMGMMMLPPVLISLPFKLLLFVLADGWQLVTQSLLYSFQLP